MKKSRCWFLIVTLLFSAGFSLSSAANAEETELKAVGFLPKNHPLAAMTVEWANRVNKEFEGSLSIKYLGGPEITAPVEQIQALKNRVFDVNFNVTSYYAPQAPELNAFQLSKMMPWEERKPGGFYEYMLDRHEKIGVFYLGRWIYGSFYIWTKDPVEKPDDLRGRKLRTGPMYIYFMNKLGVAAVSIKPPDVYTALERGTVDGFAWPLLGARERGWTDSTKYLIDHPFYGMDATILLNMDAWNKLSKANQEKLLDLTEEFERDMVAHFNQEMERERGQLREAGVQFVRFSDADAQKYIKMADDAYWENLEEKVPDLIPDLKRVTAK